MKRRQKVLTVLDSRCEVVRLAHVIKLLDQHSHHVLVHTGLNSDYPAGDESVCGVEVRRPNHFLHVNRETLGTFLGDVMVKVEAVLDVERPDAVLVVGDTDSAFAAVIARRMGIPVCHLEAGNRSSAPSAAEQITGRVISQMSDFNFVSTEHACRNLLAAGVQPQQIYIVGAPVRLNDENRVYIDVSEIRDTSTRIVKLVLSAAKHGRGGSHVVPLAA